VAKIKTLERLYLNESGIRGKDLQALHGLTRLRHLDLTKNSVTAGSVNTLRKRLPQCEIVTDLPRP
jgi:hypothetical protein